MSEETREFDSRLENQSAMIDDVLKDFIPPTEAAPAVEAATEVAPEVPAVETPAVSPEVVAPEVVPPETPAEAVVPPIDAAPPVEPVAPVVPPVAPATPAAETLEQRLQRENAELRATLTGMAEKLGPQAPAPMTPEQKEAAVKEAASQIMPFLNSNEQFDEVMRDKDNFNALLTAVVNTAVERGLRLVPTAVTQIVDTQIVLKTAVGEFYRVNEDLIPHKKYVGFVSQELTAEHPEYDLPTLLEKTEEIVRSRLKLPARTPAAQRVENVGPNGQPLSSASNTIARTVTDNPGFVPSSGGGRSGPGQVKPLTGQEKQIMDLIS